MLRMTIHDQTLQVPESQVGQRIDLFVQQLTGLSRSQIAGLFDHGCVWLDDVVCRHGGWSLESGQQLRLCYDQHRRYHPLPKRQRPSGFDVLYEDQDLIVVDKPAGVLTVPAERPRGICLLEKVDAYVRSGRGRRSQWGAFTVHRLDRDVSGVLVFGKTQAMAERLRDQFALRKPQRVYEAIVAGRFEPQAQTYRSFLATDRDLNRYSTDDPEAGQLAITHVRTVQRFESASQLEVQLETGRRNQIRVHLAEAGHPILGDPRYRPRQAQHPEWPYRRIALHAASLGFVHPQSGRQLAFRSPRPREFLRLLEALDKQPSQTEEPPKQRSANRPKPRRPKGPRRG
jgi:23S rRNA pseudouridine1911/1915/1917 synthase